MNPCLRLHLTELTINFAFPVAFSEHQSFFNMKVVFFFKNKTLFPSSLTGASFHIACTSFYHPKTVFFDLDDSIAFQNS
jgi:hypothetical protein